MSEEKTLEQLQAQAYRQIQQVELWQAQLRQTNELIANFKPVVVEAEESNEQA